MTSLYHAFVYNPLYNVLVFLISAFPALNVGWVIIIFTVFVKLLLFPLSRATIKNQIKIKKLEPKMAELRVKFKDNQQALSMEMMNLYKNEKTNPFAGVFLVLIQLPILFALYRVFWAGGLPTIHTELLYSFVNAPLHPISMFFFGLDMSKASAVLAVLAGISQYFQISLSIPQIKNDKKKGDAAPEGSLSAEVMQNMTSQMKYVMPVIITLVGLKLTAALTLYWVVSNIFGIAQELLVRRRLEAEHA